MPWSFSAPTRIEVDFLVCFADLTRFEAVGREMPPHQLAEWMQGYYELCAQHVDPAGGKIVKFIGDAMLAVFPAQQVDVGVLALLALKQATDDSMIAAGLPSRLVVKAHFGPVVAGLYGPASDQRFDVLGMTVNTAARLESRGVSISVDTFRKLSPDTRKRFQKHTAPIVYIPIGSDRPGR